MAFERPTLQQLIVRVEGDLKSGLGLVTILRRSFIGVLARVLAGLSHLLFGYLKFIEAQAAEVEYLERWASVWGVTRNEATFAQFVCDVTGTAGVVIPVGRTYRRTDGSEYTTDAEVILTGSGDQIELTAVVAGAASEVQVADVISILSPIAGLNSNATVDTVTIEPEDTESDESLRARLIDKIQNPPSGGSATDYLQWALSVPGITRAWVGPQALGPGTVLVHVVSDDEDPITPSPAKITEVADYIETVRPVTANVTVAAPALLDLDMTIQIKPNTVAVQNAIIAELEDLLFREAAVADSYKTPLELNDGKILLSKLNEAISLASDEQDHLITLINGGAPADVTPSTGELIVLGAIIWQTLA
jgi:uncharacterized phage protein gp47/JayE